MQVSVMRSCQHESRFLRMKSDIRERTSLAGSQTRLGHSLDVSPTRFPSIEDVTESVLGSDGDESQAGAQVEPRCQSAAIRSGPIEPLNTDGILMVSGPELPQIPEFDSVWQRSCHKEVVEVWAAGFEPVASFRVTSARYLKNLVNFVTVNPGYDLETFL
jgi:hypothetical protein